MNCPSPEDRPADPRIAFFDRLALRWDGAEQDPLDTVARVEACRDLLDLRPGEDLLEVGCGTGQLTDWLVQQVRPGRVVAIDFSETMLNRAKAKCHAAEFRLADVCCDGLGEGCFDVVLCFHSFPHFRDPVAAMSNMAASLRQGGRFIVMHLASRAEVNAFHDQVGGEVANDHLPQRSTWNILLRPFGLECQTWIDRDDLFLLSAMRYEDE